MKQIVLLASSYYPKYSAVGKCMGNIADVLDETYCITVICYKDDIEQATTEQHKMQEIHRISTAESNARMRIESKTANEKNVLKRYLFRSAKQIVRFNSFARTILSKQSIRIELVNEYFRALINLEMPIHAIIPSCTPFEAVAAALKYKEKYSCVKVIPVLFDLFAENSRLHRLKINKAIKQNENRKLELDMFKKSDAILHVSNWTGYIKKNYPEFIEKTIEIEHPLLIIPDKEATRIVRKEADRRNYIKVVFAGTLLKNYVEPDYAIQLFSSELLSSCKLKFYSKGSAAESVARCKSSRISLHGWVSRETLESEYEDADVLLSISEKNGKQMSSKIFDYISHKKPIIHIYYQSDDINLRFLKSYPAALTLKSDRNALESNIDAILQFLDTHVNKSVSASIDLTQGELRKCTPQYISRYIEDIIEP